MFYVLTALALLSTFYTIGYARHVFHKPERRLGAIAALLLHVLAAALPLYTLHW